jgi:hypothetical protein
MTPDERHPVLVGLAALAGVAIAVGAVLGLVGVFASRAAGIGGDVATDTGASLYLPSPVPTEITIGSVVIPAYDPSAPVASITLPGDTETASPATSAPAASESPSETPSSSGSPSASGGVTLGPSAPPAFVDTATTPTLTPITLVAAKASVAPMENITLTGSYPDGEGAVIQVQRKSGSHWVDFPVPGVAVTGGRFSTYIQTGQPGAQSFRVIDVATHRTSNVVQITVS